MWQASRIVPDIHHECHDLHGFCWLTKSDKYTDRRNHKSQIKVQIQIHRYFVGEWPSSDPILASNSIFPRPPHLTLIVQSSQIQEHWNTNTNTCKNTNTNTIQIVQMFDYFMYKARSMLHTGTCLVQIAKCTVQHVYTEILQSPNTVQICTSNTKEHEQIKYN